MVTETYDCQFFEQKYSCFRWSGLLLALESGGSADGVRSSFRDGEYMYAEMPTRDSDFRVDEDGS